MEPKELPLEMIYDENHIPFGYDTKDVRKYMKEKGLLDKWNDWYMGSTGDIIDGHFVVYYWDIDAFLSGAPNRD